MKDRRPLLHVLGAIAVAGVIAAVAIPEVQAARERKIAVHCDDLDRTIDRAAPAGPYQDPGDPTTAARLVIERRAGYRNPRDLTQPAYVLEGAVPCQVQLEPGEGFLAFRQRPAAGMAERTFSVVLD